MSFFFSIVDFFDYMKYAAIFPNWFLNTSNCKFLAFRVISVIIGCDFISRWCIFVPQLLLYVYI